MPPETPSTIAPAERARLALKGQILYGKYCGTKGRGICAESFARHQLALGHVEAVTDLINFLEAQVVALRASDPAGLLALTISLAERIRDHRDEGAEPVCSEPNRRRVVGATADAEAGR